MLRELGPSDFLPRPRTPSWVKWAGLGAAAVAVTVVGMLVAALSLVALAKSFQADAKPPDSIVVEKDVPYRKVEGKSLLLDLARPKQGDGPFPVVVCIHGGGWRQGDRKEQLQAVQSLAQQGYVAVTVQYRFAPGDHFPAQVQDVQAAVRYVRSRSKALKIDPNRVGALGGSAGGHLALLLGTTDSQDFGPVDEYPEFSSRVQAVVSLAGPTDLSQNFPPLVEQMVTDLIGKPRNDAPAAYLQASPIHHLGANDAPILAIHGTKDELVPYSQATALIAACKKTGVKAELLTIEDGGHGSGGKPADWVAAIVGTVKFLDKHLKPAGNPSPPPKP